MILVSINGERFEAAGTTIGERLRAEGRKYERVAVMINGDILPKSEYDSRILQDGDEVDIVGFVGGG